MRNFHFSFHFFIRLPNSLLMLALLLRSVALAVPSRETNEKMKWKMKISHKFRKFLVFSEFFSHFFAKYRDSLSFPEHFCEIPAKFHQIFAEKSQISSKNENEKWNFIFIPAKIWTFFCWNFEIWAVQRNANLVDLEKCCKMRLFSLS